MRPHRSSCPIGTPAKVYLHRQRSPRPNFRPPPGVLLTGMMRSNRCYPIGLGLPLSLLGQPVSCVSSRQTAIHSEAVDPGKGPGTGITIPPTRWAPRQQAIHVLNRLAYGPSPADLEAVERMGVAGGGQMHNLPRRTSDAACAAE